MIPSFNFFVKSKGSLARGAVVRTVGAFGSKGMGYSELDLKLMEAWFAVRDRAVGAGADRELVETIFRRHAGKLLSRPLRSWSLVLRASDGRIPDDSGMGVVRVDRSRVVAWCGRVRIDRPGVSMDEASALLGVNRTTVSRWATPAGHRSWKAKLDADEAAEAAAAEHDKLLRRCRAHFGTPTTRVVHGKLLNLSYTINRSNRRKDEVRVWTPTGQGVDPGGEVLAGPGDGGETGETGDQYWAELRSGLAKKLPDDFEQVLTRVDRRLSARARVWQWYCPVEAGGCGQLVYKLYLPMPVWTLIGAIGGRAGQQAREEEASEAGLDGFSVEGLGGILGGLDAINQGFVCLKCAGLLYESSERTSVPGRRKDGSKRAVDTWDRFIKRVSGGVLTGREVGRGADYAVGDEAGETEPDLHGEQ